MGANEQGFIRWLMGRCVEIEDGFGAYSKKPTHLGCDNIFPLYRSVCKNIYSI